jgi:hypothetical protein
MCGDWIHLPPGMLRWLAVINTVIQVPWNAAIFLTRRATTVRHFSLLFFALSVTYVSLYAVLERRSRLLQCPLVLFTKMSGSAPGPTSIWGVPGAHSSVWKRPGHEANHSSPSGAEVMNEWSYTSLHHMPLWNVLSVSWNKHVLGLHRIVWRKSSNYEDFLVSAGT